ncbi:MAG: sigma-70 family RNA polymerase sigma factor [Clostridia bacterium]|nr:sigma-70 family RNA polymerase sigma factor [Clostridia bacterium]
MKEINKQELHSFFQDIANKNEEKFNQFYEKYHILVYRIAFSILKNKEDSEDVGQKVFLKIWKMEQEKLPTNNEASWLYTITKNEALNYLRSKKQEIDIDDVYYMIDEKQELDQIIDKESYHKMIAKLNQQEQEIVCLKILSKLSFKEIAQILHMPIGTVQWKYYKSLYTLRILLGNLTILIVSVLSLQIGRTAKGGPVFSILPEKNKEESMEETQNTGNESAKGDSLTNVMPDVSEIIEKDPIEENTIKNETIQPDIPQNVVTYSKTQIGLLGVTVISFIFTIIFSIIFIKHQQNARKKVSK